MDNVISKSLGDSIATSIPHTADDNSTPPSNMLNCLEQLKQEHAETIQEKSVLTDQNAELRHVLVRIVCMYHAYYIKCYASMCIYGKYM